MILLPLHQPLIYPIGKMKKMNYFQEDFLEKFIKVNGKNKLLSKLNYTIRKINLELFVKKL